MRPDQMIVGRTYRVLHREPAQIQVRQSVMRLMIRSHHPDRIILKFDARPVTADEMTIDAIHIVQAEEVPADTPRTVNATPSGCIVR